MLAILAVLAPLFITGSLLAQSDTNQYNTIPQAGGAASALMMLVMAAFEFAIAAFIIFVLWKVFVKAGQPGWAAIIPIYNTYIMCKIAGRSGWWVLLLCIPLVGVVFFIILMLDFAKSFGKGAGFAVGLILLGPIFFAILAFGDATYLGPAALKQS